MCTLTREKSYPVEHSTSGMGAAGLASLVGRQRRHISDSGEKFLPWSSVLFVVACPEMFGESRKCFLACMEHEGSSDKIKPAEGEMRSVMW